MTLDTWLLLGTILLMVANRGMHVLSDWHRRKAVFWSVQLANLVVACLLVTLGIPGFTGPLKIVNLLLAGLLVLHIVQNNRHYLLAWRRGEEPVDEEREARRAAVLEKLKAPEE